MGAVNRARAVLTALVLSSALALSGCSGDDPEPKFAPPSSEPPESPSTTAASGPSEPEMPEAAKGTDAAAAEAFVKFYWAMVNYAQETGDVDGLRRLSRNCQNCDAGAKSIEDTYAADGVIGGGANRADHFDTIFLDRPAGDWAIVEFGLTTAEQHIDRPGSDDDSDFPGGRTDIRMILQPSGDAWIVRSVEKA
jgi:hypothetical protein